MKTNITESHTEALTLLLSKLLTSLVSDNIAPNNYETWKLETAYVVICVTTTRSAVVEKPRDALQC